MNENKLKKLLELFLDSEVQELELEHSFWRGTRIRISRQGNQSQTRVAPAASPAVASMAVDDEKPPEEVRPPAVETDETLHLIRSPMVGSFYRSSAPESEAFVKEGDRVRLGQTVCIIEAMKIMNEVVADAEGEVVEILVESADPVEFNQPLMKIRPF